MKITKIPKTREKSIYEKKLNVAAYVRVSTLLESQQTSFNSQYEYYKDRINKIVEWNFAGIYSDEGISGRKDFNRTSFMNMIEDALDGKIDLILTKSISRFARNTVDSLKYIRLLKANGIGIIFEEENINTLDIGGELLISIFSSIAQIESENISARVTHGLLMLADNNNYNDYNVPFGYNYVPKSKKITINKKRSQVVKLIFDLSLNGYTIKKIVKYLIDNNIYKSKKWSTFSIYSILTNHKYYGRVVTVIDNKEYIWDDLYPKIISKETFDYVQQQLRSRKVIFETNECKRLFKGKLKCGSCYSTLFFRMRKQRWYCDNRNCISHSYNEKLIYDCFDVLINELLKLDYSFKSNSKVRKLKYKKELLNNQVDKLIDNLLDKKINYKNFNNKQDKLIEYIVNIENEININIKEKKQQLLFKNYVGNLKKEIIDNYKDKEKLFNIIVTRIYLTVDSKLRYLKVDFIYDNGFNNVRNEKGYYLNNTYITLLKKFIKYDFKIRRNLNNFIQISKIRITYNVKEEELNGSRSYKKESR